MRDALSVSLFGFHFLNYSYVRRRCQVFGDRKLQKCYLVIQRSCLDLRGRERMHFNLELAVAIIPGSASNVRVV